MRETIKGNPTQVAKRKRAVIAIVAICILALMTLTGCSGNQEVSGGWEAFKYGLFWIIERFYDFTSDWGMAIIVVTLIFRLIITPLMYMQTRSTYRMQKIQPKIEEIKQRFGNDQVRMNQEMQKVYAEAKFNPIGGCLPLILQMPIFIALFQTLRELETYIGTGESYCFYNLIKDLTVAPSGAFEQGVTEFIPYLILMIIFAGATFLPMMLQNMKANSSNSSQRKQTLIMGVVMTIMMLWISWGSPAGVLLFWGASSLIGIAQQQISMYVLRRKDAKVEAETIDVKPVEVNVVRKPQKKRIHKKR